jgi:hypothetical protein
VRRDSRFVLREAGGATPPAYSPEEIFDLQQIAIAEHGLQRRHVRVRPEHEDSIKTGLFGELSKELQRRGLVRLPPALSSV